MIIQSAVFLCRISCLRCSGDCGTRVVIGLSPLPGHHPQPRDPFLQRRVRTEQLHERASGQRMDNKEVSGLRRRVERDALRVEAQFLQRRR